MKLLLNGIQALLLRFCDDKKRQFTLKVLIVLSKLHGNQNVHMWQQILQNVEFEWILNNGLKRGSKSSTLVDNEDV
jgi:hypothetical protein